LSTPFSTFNCGGRCGRERGERERERREKEKESRVGSSVSKSYKTIFFKAEYATF
jgi:hypothetical protein